MITEWLSASVPRLYMSSQPVQDGGAGRRGTVLKKDDTEGSLARRLITMVHFCREGRTVGRISHVSSRSVLMMPASRLLSMLSSRAAAVQGFCGGRVLALVQQLLGHMNTATRCINVCNDHAVRSVVRKKYLSYRGWCRARACTCSTRPMLSLISLRRSRRLERILRTESS